MARPANLELLSALTNNKITQVPTTTRTNLKSTLEDATGYWIRHHRGKGWVIANIEISLSLDLIFEHSPTETKTLNLGLLNENTEAIKELSQHPLVLVCVEIDKLTPTWVAQTVQYMVTQPQSKLLILERAKW